MTGVNLALTIAAVLTEAVLFEPFARRFWFWFVDQQTASRT